MQTDWKETDPELLVRKPHFSAIFDLAPKGTTDRRPAERPMRHKKTFSSDDVRGWRADDACLRTIYTKYSNAFYLRGLGTVRTYERMTPEFIFRLLYDDSLSIFAVPFRNKTWRARGGLLRFLLTLAILNWDHRSKYNSSVSFSRQSVQYGITTLFSAFCVFKYQHVHWSFGSRFVNFLSPKDRLCKCSFVRSCCKNSTMQWTTIRWHLFTLLFYSSKHCR
jgi:hypothetical protein